MGRTVQMVLPKVDLINESLGEEHMIEMLLKTSVFIALKNDYYTQLTGRRELTEI